MFDMELLPEIELVAEMIEGKRYYLTPEGNKYPSVTTILSQLNAKGIAEWRARVGEEEANRISTQAASRGTKIHSIAENYVLGKPMPSSVMPSHLEMFKPLKKYLDNHLQCVYGSEIALYSDRLKLAGRCDLVARIGGIPTIVDFKTARKPKEEQYILNYFLQATTYAAMVKERHQLPVKALAILIMTEHDGLQVFHRPINQFIDPLLDYLRSIKHVDF